MLDEEDDDPRNYFRTAGKESVNEALRLLRNRPPKKRKRQAKIREQILIEMDHQCSVPIEEMSKREKYPIKAFYHHYAFKEMRNALLNRDYKSLQEIFLLLVKCAHNEPFMWRYAFLIYLLSPATNISQFQDFIERCLGEEALTDGRILESLITLPNNVKK